MPPIGAVGQIHDQNISGKRVFFQPTTDTMNNFSLLNIQMVDMQPNSNPPSNLQHKNPWQEMNKCMN